MFVIFIISHYYFCCKCFNIPLQCLHSHTFYRRNHLIIIVTIRATEKRRFFAGYRLNTTNAGSNTVFTYDHTGCRESEGENIVGFAQSLCDLDYAVNAVRAVEGYKDVTISVIGHSWGGFAALNIPALHKDIESCVSISGFIAVERIIEQFFPGILRFYRPSVLRLEREANPMYSLIDARRSLKDTSARILYIASDDDPTVKMKYHYDSLVGNQKVEHLLVHGKKHNPNYTAEAVAELTKMTDAMTEGLKKNTFKTPEDVEKFRTSWDWHKITEQDGALWGKIFDFIEGGSK